MSLDHVERLIDRVFEEAKADVIEYDLADFSRGNPDYPEGLSSSECKHSGKSGLYKVTVTVLIEKAASRQEAKLGSSWTPEVWHK